VATSFTLGNPLKFGLDPCHNAKGRPTFLHKERETAPEAYANNTHIHWEGPPMGPLCTGAVATMGGRKKAGGGGLFRLAGWG